MSHHTPGLGGTDAYLSAEIAYRASKVRDDWAPVRRSRRLRRAPRPRRSA